MPQSRAEKHNSFTFKQFAIKQAKCAMKVGTDGVLLGAWAEIAPNSQVLDIGTGTGLIALMLAQRYPTARITAVEIDEQASTQAMENVQLSPFAGQIDVQCADIHAFAKNSQKRFDAIVCNPPYFIDSLKCPDRERSQARHNDTLTLDDLLHISLDLLTESGSLQVVLPTAEAITFVGDAHALGLYTQRILHVYPTPTSDEKRRLVQLSRTSDATAESDLVIELERHQYTNEYQALTRDFYLKF